MNKQSGFTLIELMIAVMVIAVLASIAIPSYQNYVLRTNRTEGQALLAEAAARQERFFTQNSRYATTIAELGFASANSQNALYQLAITANANPVQFTMTATPINSQTRDTGCGTLALNQQGTRTVTGANGVEECWR